MLTIKNSKGKIILGFSPTTYDKAREYFQKYCTGKKRIYTMEGRTIDKLNIVIVFFPNSMNRQKFFDTPSDKFLESIPEIMKPAKVGAK